MDRRLPHTAPVPTLLVLTLGPEEDARRHPLLPQVLAAHERRLRRTCLESVARAGHDAGCRVVLCSPRPLQVGIPTVWLAQRGTSLGERFAHALAAAGDLGGPIVAVGGDTPGLSRALIEAALAEIARSPERVVIGPARDGGFYLLATSRPLAPNHLARVKWCSSSARSTLVESLRAGGVAVAALSPLADLDTSADLERWLKSGPAPCPQLLGERHVLRRVLARQRRPRCRARRVIEAPALATSAGRAPPLAASS